MLSSGVIVFVLTYLLISMRRLRWLGFDRPAGALLGAVAAVATGALDPSEALEAVDRPTLLLLFGVMGMGAFLALDGFFDHVEAHLLRWAATPVRLLTIIVWSAGILAAFITNDAVCVLGTPLVVRCITRYRLPPLPFLLALATAANTGSVATLVGNPQNMLCGALGGLVYRDYLVSLGPVALVGLFINRQILIFVFRRELENTSWSVDRSSELGAIASTAAPSAGESRPLETGIRTRPPSASRSRLTLFVIFATAVAYTLGADLPWTAATGFVVLMLVHRRDTSELWSRIDWSLLLFFGGLFVVVAGFVKSGVPSEFFARFPLRAEASSFLDWLRLTAIFLFGSNVVSNVPFILVVREAMSGLPDPKLAWALLAMASTFAGNLTLLGSVANIIVAEGARDLGGIGFVQYLKVGAPIALATTLFGVLWLWLWVWL